MIVTFPSHEAFNYVEVFRVVEWRRGTVYKTVHKGYAHRNRRPEPDEVYAPLSTTLTKGSEITVDLLPDFSSIPPNGPAHPDQGWLE